MHKSEIFSYLLVAKMLSTNDGATIQEMAEALHVTERTIFKKLRDWQDLGLAVYSEPDPYFPRRFRYKSYNSPVDLFEGYSA